MTPNQLKNSILQLAIQGKLVEQRPEEGTAEELFDKIKIALPEETYKPSKSRGKNIIQPIPLDNLPFDIPSSWEWVRLGTIGFTNIGLTYKPTDISNEGVIVLRSSNIKNDRIDYTDIVRVKIDVPENKMCHKGDLLICVRNGSKKLVGKSVIIDNEGFSYGAFMAIFRSVCNKYLLQVINSAYFRNSILGDTDTTTINQITQDVLKNVLIPLPPLAEQHRIVAKIEELLPMVEKYGEAYNKLETLNKNFPAEIKKSILQYAIQGKLVEQRPEEGTAEELYKQIQTEKAELIKQGKLKKEKPLPPIKEEEIPFDIPNTWKWVKLGNTGYTNIGLTYKPTDIANEGTVVLRSSNIQNGKIDYNDIVKVKIDVPDNKMCHKGDILICVRNGSKKLVGKSAIIESEGFAYGAFMAIFRSVCNNYILQIFHSAYFRNSLLGDTNTTTINQITQDILKNVLIPLPPLAEQHRIVAKIEELFAYVDTLSNKS